MKESFQIIIKKLGFSLLVLIGVSILTFTLGRLAPGDPIDIMFANKPNPTAEDIRAAEEYLGIGEPVYVQYVKWVGKLLSFDFGVSYKSGGSVRHEFAVRFPQTLSLTFVSVLVMILIGFPIGIISALNRNKIPDVVLRISNILAISIPSFCIGILLILFFGVKLQLLPTIGSGSFKHIIMPSVAIGLGAGAGLARLIRTQMINIMEMEHVYAAKAYGVKGYLIVINDIIKNALPPIVTDVGLRVGALLGGTAIIENLFSYQGVGSYLIEAIGGRDYPIIQAYAIMMAVIYIVIDLALDVSYEILSPHIKTNKEKL